MKRANRRWLAQKLTAAVLILQAAVLLTFFVDESDPPSAGSLWQLIWGYFHRPSFYPLAALVIGGPVMTWLAWVVRGPHRVWLVGGWAAFIPIVWLAHGNRLSVMLKLLWQHITT